MSGNQLARWLKMIKCATGLYFGAANDVQRYFHAITIDSGTDMSRMGIERFIAVLHVDLHIQVQVSFIGS